MNGRRPTAARGYLSFCLLSTFYPPLSFGGDAVHVHRLATGLADSGHRVRVVHNAAAYRLLAGSSTPAEGYSTHPGVEVVRAPATALATAATYMIGTPAGYRRALDELTAGFDVVHLHNPSLLGGPGVFGLGSGVRLYTTHEHWLLCPTHALFRYGREVCTHRTCWRCTISYHRPPQLWRSTSLLPRGLRGLHALLAPSRFTAELHRRAFPDVRVEVLPLLGPPRHGPSPVTATPSVGRPFFIYAGRLEPIKGVDHLIRAFATVHGADLIVAGDGAQAHALHRLAAGNIAIRFLGRIPPYELAALLRRALALVAPSVGYETFGGAAVEAMTVGTPAVVRDIGPLPELVESGGGLVFADDEDLARTLQLLVDTPSLVERLRAEATTVAALRSGHDAFFGRYFKIIGARAAAAGFDELAQRAASAGAGR